MRETIHELDTTSGGIIGLVDFQGVGKSSALLAILAGRMLPQDQEYDRTRASKAGPDLGQDTIRFKWRRQPELLTSLMNNTDEASADPSSRFVLEPGSCYAFDLVIVFIV